MAVKKNKLGVGQAAKQVYKNKASVYHPGADFTIFAEGGKVGPNYDVRGMNNPTYNGSNWAPKHKGGGTIHIKKENRGKFNATKKATGKSTEALTHSNNPVTKKRAIFAQNAAKWHHKANGGWIQEYAQGGRTINPAMGGQMIGGQHAYPPLAPYPAMYGFGGVLQSFAPFVSMIPGVGTAAGTAMGLAGGLLDQASDDKTQEELLMKQRQQQAQASQAGITGNARPTFSWGGRLPETRLPMSPSGLTLGHVPGYDSNSNYGGTNVPPKGWDYRMVKGKNEGTNWHRETNMNVRRHTYAAGGGVNPTYDRAVTTVRNNRFIPLTERQFYEQAIQPTNDTLSWDQFNALPATLAERSKYLPNMDYQIQQGKRGSTVNKGYLKYYQNNPKDMGTDITTGGQPIFKQPSQVEINKQFPQHSMYPMGGQINDNLEVQGMQPVELEKQEVFQTPSGQMGQVDGPSHAEGGINMQLPENSFVWSDKLKTSRGNTFAEEASRLGRLKAKYEKTLEA
jgi:hypothetical protein